MKTKIKFLSFIAFVVTSFLSAQNNTSIDANSSTPIVGGSDNCGFGYGALNGLLFFPSSGTGNTGTGFGALNQLGTGNNNSANGKEALFNNEIGSENTASGYRALYNAGCATCVGSGSNTATGSYALYANTAQFNTANGNLSLFDNTLGEHNTADGYMALYQNITGKENTALGHNALKNNTYGDQNTAAGTNALYSNTFGSRNTALGKNSLYSNNPVTPSVGNDNTALGNNSMYSNISGSKNTAIGFESLFSNTYGNGNSAIGKWALFSNTTGNNNVAIGTNAAISNSTGSDNVAIGWKCLLNSNADGNTFAGDSSGIDNSSAEFNTVIGNAALLYTAPSGSNTLLGAWTDVVGTYSNQTVIGYNSLGLNIDDAIMLGDGGVTVETQFNFAVTSDARFKYNVKENVKGLEFIKLLKPVSYNFDFQKLAEHRTKNLPANLKKRHLDKDFSSSTELKQTGFIAQEVAKAANQIEYEFSGLHKPDNDNDHYSLAYGMFVVPLVKAVQEQQIMLDDQTQTIKTLQKELEEQIAALENLSKKSHSETGLVKTSGDKTTFSMEAQPNPFSYETLIRYTLPDHISSAYLSIYNLSGTQLLSYPLNEKGSGSILITSENLNPGMYVYSIISGSKILGSKRLIVSGK